MKPTLVAAAIAILISSPAAADTTPAYRVVVDQKSEAGRVVEVRLEHRLDNAELGAIVNAIIDREPRAYPRTTVNFLLASSRISDSPWASATSMRETQIRVPGLTAEEERGYRADAVLDRRAVVGAWLTSTPATPGRLTLYREHGRLMLDWQMRGGLARTGELAETPMPAGTRLDHVGGSFDTHFLLSADGVLEIHSKGMLVAIGERITGDRAVVVALARDKGASSTIVQPWPMPEGDFITSSLRDSAESSMRDSDEPRAAYAEPSSPVKPASQKASRRPASVRSAAAPMASDGIDIGKVFFGQ